MISEKTLKIIKSRRSWSTYALQHRLRVSNEWAEAIKNELIELNILKESSNWRGCHDVNL